MKKNTITIYDKDEKKLEFIKPSFDVYFTQVLKDSIIGYVEEKVIVNNKEQIFRDAVQWDFNGKEIVDTRLMMIFQSYSLTKYEGEWYENKDNFPAVVVNKNGTMSIVYSYRSNILVNFTSNLNISMWKLATKEQVSKLKMSNEQ